MSFDFNDADQSKPKDMLIPHGTIVPVHMTIRPGGSGDGNWLKRSSNGQSMALDAEFTVIDGDWNRKKFWTLFTIEGETEGQKKAAEISRSNIRAMLESARGIEPSDASEKAVAARRISGFQDLDDLRMWVVVKLEKGTDGYKDKNQFSYAVTPDRKEWSKLEQSASSPARATSAPAAARPAAASQPVARASSARPGWAGGASRQAAPQAASRPDIDDNIPF